MADLDRGMLEMEDDRLLLCLNCRLRGHLALECEEEWTPKSKQFEWFFSPNRRSIGGILSETTGMCQRCRSLDILSLLRSDIPWRSPQELITAHKDGNPLIRSLGYAGSIIFRSTCPVCVCLFAMTPSPASAADQITLYPDWNWNRLAGENGTQLDREEQQRYAKCLLITIEPNATNISVYIRGHRGDALCIVEEDLLPTEALGGRLIETKRFNIEQCSRWIESCIDLHGADCKPEYTDELAGIRLLDVQERRIVSYPGTPCQYAALSYVWGGIGQKSYGLGSKPIDLPRTIEDAMTCTKMLGFRYLWVDSLCIDQNNEADKEDQIDRMWSIYRGSSVTIITLSSSSADSGLPNLRSEIELQPQLSCTIDGVRLVGLMPTLSQYIWTEHWGSRAWTLQEALLSHRCLYISDHQLYFECEVIQHCESLDERHSWAHHLKPSDSPDQKHWLTWIMEQNGSGCLRNLLDTPADRLLHWGQKVTLYSYRAMTNQEDGLRAFSGVLQRLQTMYKAGFLWGMPLEDFQWALLWQAQWPPQRRPGFPTWCWAAWQAGIMTPFPANVKKPHLNAIPLRIWKAKDQKLLLIFDSDKRGSKAAVHDKSSSRRVYDGNSDHPADEGIPEDSKGTKSEQTSEPTDSSPDVNEIFNLSIYQDAEEFALFMEVLTVQLKPDWSRPRHGRAIGGLRAFFLTDISGIECQIYIMTKDPLIGKQKEVADEPKYLMIAANGYADYDEYHLLVVYDLDGVCLRGTSLSLFVPKVDVLKVLQALQLRREYVVLA